MIRPSLRTLLVLGTALGSATTPALAQSVQLPRATDGQTVARSPNGSDALITRAGNTLNVTLGANATVINWNGFNVPENSTASFRSLTPADVAVLNRDVSGRQSQLLGRVSSTDNVAVWIMNASGILVGPRAALSTGSLVLTTLDVDQTNFLANGNAFRLSAPDARVAGIDVVNGAQIRTANGPRGLVMVAPRIDAAGIFDAGDGQVAFVTASDVTLTYNPGSPLSVTLNRGTVVPRRSQYVRGSVDGADAIFALATQGTVTDGLLQVDAGVTTAVAGARGIILSAGRPGIAVAGVETAATAGAADGAASLVTTGAMLAGNDAAGIVAVASGAATIDGPLDAGGDVTLASDAALTVAGDVRGGAVRATAGGDARLGQVSGTTVAVTATRLASVGGLVASGDAQVRGGEVALAGIQTAGGSYTATATSGALRGAAGLSITADADGVGGGTVSLAAGGPVSLDPDSQLVGGSAAGTAISVTAGGEGITLGGVRGGSLTVSGATGPIRTGDLTLAGDVSLTAAAGVTTGAVEAGAVQVDGGSGRAVVGTVRASAVTLRGASVGFGTATVGSLAATAVAGGVDGGDVTATGAVQVSARDDVTVARVAAASLDLGAGGAVRVGDLAVGGLATVRGASVGFGTATVGSLAATAVAGGVDGGDVTATGAVQVSARDDVTVARVAATSLDLGAGGAVRVGDLDIGGIASLRGAAVRFGAATVDTLSATASAGDIDGGAVTATGAVRVSASGTATAVRVTAGALDVGAGGAVQLGDLTIGGLAAVRGGVVRLGAVDAGVVAASASAGALVGGTVTARGPVRLEAATAANFGRVAAAGDVAVTATGAIALDGLDAGGTAMLTANGASGDVLVRDGAAAVGSMTVAAGRDVRTPFLRSAAGNLAVTAPAGDITGFLPGDPISLSAGPGGTVSLVGGRALTLGDLAGRSVQVEAPSLRVGTVDAGNGAGAGIVALRATTGDLAATGAITGGTVTLSAANRVAVNDVTAGGALTLSGTGGIGFGTVAGASVSAVSAGLVSGGAVRSAGAVTVTGGAVSLDAVTAGGSATLTAASGNLALGNLQAGGDALLSATGGVRVTGAGQVGGAYRLSGAGVDLGGAAQQAGGVLRVTAGSGGITGSPGLRLGGTQVVLDTSGGIALAGSRVDTPGALAIRAGQGAAVRLGGIAAGAIGGFDGNGVVSDIVHDGSFTADDVTATTLAIRLRTGDLTLGRVTAGGAVSLSAATGPIATGAVNAGTLVLDGGGAVTSGAIAVGGAARVSGASITTGDVRAATLTIRSAGALGGAGGAAPTLTTTAGDLGVDARTMRLRAIDAAGSATVRGDTIEVAGRLSAARQALVEARAALSLGDVAAGDAATLTAGGVLTTGALRAGGAVSATGAGVSIASASAGTTIDVKSSGPATLNGATAAGAITLNAGGTATLGAIAAGPSVAITAGDADLRGPVRAAAVTFATTNPATTALRVGDGTEAGGFALSAAEVNQVATDRLRLDAGAGAMEIGSLALGAETGQAVELLSRGEVRVIGAVTAAGTGRSIRIGGDAGDTAMAASIQVVATGDAGGRLLVASQDLDLRGDRIAVGLVPGFLSALSPGEAGRTQAGVMIGSGNSALYNARLGGAAYATEATTTVAARSLSVRFGDFALFQNTGTPGVFSGATLGTVPATPGLTALRVITSSGNPAQANFALFGTINGVTGAATALLGTDVIDIDPRLLGTSRLNGCLTGSTAGCLTTIVIQPTLQVFNWNSEDVFGIAQDVAVPFDPIVGGNNEGLLTSLSELAPSAERGDVAPAGMPSNIPGTTGRIVPFVQPAPILSLPDAGAPSVMGLAGQGVQP